MLDRIDKEAEVSSYRGIIYTAPFTCYLLLE
jgi:hypothetical protein